MEKEKKKFSFIDDVVKPIISALVLAFLVTNFVLRFVVVDGHSMEPTLHDRSFGISWILPLFFEDPDRFDIVVIQDHGVYMVKRVIGLPGETLEYDQGVLMVDGQTIEEDFISDTVKLETGSFSITLDDDEYFVMGDNRAHSTDSRYYGPFESSSIKGDGIWILWDND